MKPRETSNRAQHKPHLSASASLPKNPLPTGTVHKTAEAVARYARMHPDPCNPFKRHVKRNNV